MTKDDNTMLIVGGLIAAVLGYFGLNYLVNNKTTTNTQVSTGNNYTPQPPASSSGSCSKCPFGG